MGYTNENTPVGLRAVPKTLVIGDLDRWQRMGRNLPEMPGMFFTGLDALDRALFAKLQPDIVLSALVARDFDAIDIASRLQQIGFAGRYRIVAEALPNAPAVLSEIRAAAPGLDIAVLNMGRLQVVEPGDPG